jgi:RNA polymerase sigma-70 factor (ECF subfamily)
MRKKIHFINIEDKHIEYDEQKSVEDSTIWKKAKSAIQQLNPDKRMICLLHIAENYSHSEIAEMLGISEGASRITLHRAKQELRTLVSK